MQAQEEGEGYRSGLNSCQHNILDPLGNVGSDAYSDDATSRASPNYN